MNTPGTMTRIGAATHILAGIGAPINPHTVGAMLGWFNAEGGNWANNAAYNPLNTTLNAPGARPINSAGVKAYGNWGQGLSSTIQTLRQPNMSGIVNAFRGGNPQEIAHAIGSSPWGTSASLVAQTIAGATGHLGNTASIARAMAGARPPHHAGASVSVGQTRLGAGQTSTNWDSAITQAMLNDSTGGQHNDLLGDAINIAQNNPRQYNLTTPSVSNSLVSSQAMTGQAVRDAASAGVNSDAQKLINMLHAVNGGGYNQGNHNAIGESAKQIRTQGTDCSGLISWLMGPRGLGIWNTSLATPSIDQAPGMQAGRGREVTVWNNKQAGNLGHVFIQIGNQYWASEGGVGIHEISRAEALSYIQHGSDGGTYQALHPRGL